MPPPTAFPAHPAPAPLWRGLLASLPIALGYFPVAFSFALTALQAGLSGAQALWISAIVYSGAAQFVLVALLAAGGSALGMVVSIWLMNARHLFYGPSLLTALGHRHTSTPAALLGAGLTDEVFGTALGTAAEVPEMQRERWLLGLQLGAYLSWLAGTAAGALVGLQAVARVAWLNDAFAFVLPALFFTLLLDVWQRGPRATLGATAAISLGLLAAGVAGHLCIVLGMVAGALVHAGLAMGREAAR
jgi:4-azaleucine resistance transporter AzlC